MEIQNQHYRTDSDKPDEPPLSSTKESELVKDTSTCDTIVQAAIPESGPSAKQRSSQQKMDATSSGVPPMSNSHPGNDELPTPVNTQSAVTELKGPNGTQSNNEAQEPLDASKKDATRSSSRTRNKSSTDFTIDMDVPDPKPLSVMTLLLSLISCLNFILICLSLILDITSPPGTKKRMPQTNFQHEHLINASILVSLSFHLVQKPET